MLQGAASGHCGGDRAMVGLGDQPSRVLGALGWAAVSKHREAVQWGENPLHSPWVSLGWMSSP